jgi:TrmH family RNA methyltransferase
VREIGRAIEACVRVLEVFACPAMCQRGVARDLLDRLSHTAAEVLEVTEPVFRKMAFGDRAEGVLAVAQMPRPYLSLLALAEPPLVAVLEGVEKPGNLGAVVRSADGAGLSALVVAEPRTDLYNPNVIRASLGTVFTLPVCVATADQTLQWLRGRGLAVFAARVGGAIPYCDADFRQPCALVLGSEATGLTPLWSGAGVTEVRLPMFGKADSLNVSAAAAVLFYEAVRQRGVR